MKIKTKRNQLEAIVLLLTVLLNAYPPKSMIEKLIYSIVNKTFNKLRVKSESLGCPQSGWGFLLTDQEAWALYSFLTRVYLPVEEYSYEVHEINLLISQINKEHGSIEDTNKRRNNSFITDRTGTGKLN